MYLDIFILYYGSNGVVDLQQVPPLRARTIYTVISLYRITHMIFIYVEKRDQRERGSLPVDLHTI
jgi:hypothetical protein